MGGSDIVEDPERSSSINDDPELEGRTLYEKKATLVNRELDRQGMGRYQWCIFLLCGFGYMLDLMWAQALSLLVTSMQAEFGFSKGQSGNIFSSFSAGLTAGAFVWGFLVDIIGRYWAFNFTVLWASIFGLVLGAPNSYTGVIVLTAFLGFGIGGNVPIDTTIVLECLPKNRRWLLPALSAFQPVGVVICSAIAYGLVPGNSCATDLPPCNDPSRAPGAPCCTKADNWGWRYTLFTLGAITTFIFFLRFVCFRFQESPKYLLYRGHDEKAVKSLQYIAKFNKQQSHVTLDTFAALEDDASSMSTGNSGAVMLGSGSKQQDVNFKQKASLEWQRYKMLFETWSMVQLSVALWLTYAFDYWGFTIAGNFLPMILRDKGDDLGLSLAETYRSYIYIYLFGIPGVLIGASIYGWKRLSLFVSSALFGATLFIFTVVNSEASYIGINGLVYFFQSMFNALLYGTTPEMFPAPIRGTASGVCSFWGRLFSIIAPLAAQAVYAKSSNGVLYLAGSGVFISTVMILFIPKKYIGGATY